MSSQKYCALILFATLCLVCVDLKVPAQAKNPVTESKAILRADLTAVRFESPGIFSKATLTVSGPDGTVTRQEFEEGATPTFSLVNKAGSELENGQYTYEIRYANVDLSALKERTMSPDDGAKTEDENGRINRRPLAVHATVQSGTFSVINGVVYIGKEVEPTLGRPVPAKSSENTSLPIRPSISSATISRLRNHRFSLAPMPDQVIADDLIVQGSACIGLDCVNNESFGFDTIRVKENNTRIKFDDTSSAPGFPNTDWQLTANDSASGGANKFSIEDITDAKVPFTITGNAPTNSVFVDSTGRLGLRTSTPGLDIHANTSNTPAIRLEQNNSGGFAAQTWDIGANEANFFVRDQTGGSRLPFRIRPGAPTSSIDISNAGKVGVGTASPIAQLDSRIAFPKTDSGIRAGFYLLSNETSNPAGLLINMKGGVSQASRLVTIETGEFAVTNDGVLSLQTNGGKVGIGTSAPSDLLSVNGAASKPGGGSWSSFSDERLKNINGIFNSGLKAVMQLQPLRYRYKTNNVLGLKSDREYVGFGAQAVQKVIPEAVTTSQSGYLMVNNDPILWTMLNAIKEQQKEIVELKAQVKKLQASHRRKR